MGRARVGLRVPAVIGGAARRRQPGISPPPAGRAPARSIGARAAGPGRRRPAGARSVVAGDRRDEPGQQAADEVGPEHVSRRTARAGATGSRRGRRGSRSARPEPAGGLAEGVGDPLEVAPAWRRSRGCAGRAPARPQAISGRVSGLPAKVPISDGDHVAAHQPGERDGAEQEVQRRRTGVNEAKTPQREAERDAVRGVGQPPHPVAEVLDARGASRAAGSSASRRRGRGGAACRVA